MLSMRWALLFGLLAIVCLSHPSKAEEPGAEPEPGKAEPEAEPESHDEDKAGSSVGKTGEAKAATGNNPASAPWAFSVPAIIAFVSVAKFVL